MDQFGHIQVWSFHHQLLKSYLMSNSVDYRNNFYPLFLVRGAHIRGARGNILRNFGIFDFDWL